MKALLIIVLVGILYALAPDFVIYVGIYFVAQFVVALIAGTSSRET